MSPSKQSGMPITFHPYLMMAALVAARITALRPGASPPPVPIPMQRMLDIEKSVARSSLVVGKNLCADHLHDSYDNTETAEERNLPLGVGLPRYRHRIKLS